MSASMICCLEVVADYEREGNPTGANRALTDSPVAGSYVLGVRWRAQLVQRYAQLSGRDVSNLPYWVAFSRWRSACIGVGVRARYLAGHMADDGFAAGLLTSPERGEAGGRVVLAEAARDALREGGL